MKRYFLASIILSLGLVSSGCGNAKSDETSPIDKSAKIIFFYGQECPHCKIVEEYISQNNISQKVEFVQGEVYHNKANADFMIGKQKECNLSEDMIGAVPFLWTTEKCYLGDKDIVQFFKDKTGS